MDPSDSNFSQPSSSNFIVLPSQDESQLESQEVDEIRHTLTTLPALQRPKQTPKPKVPAASLHSDLCDETYTEEENKKVSVVRVLATDSEVEPTEREQTEPSDIDISESVVETDDNADITVIQNTKQVLDSDIIADTEISTSCPGSPVGSKISAQEQDDQVQVSRSQGQESRSQGQESKSVSSSQNESRVNTSSSLTSCIPDSVSVGSSFQSKDRSNLGSYDQCEVYGTQKRGHAHGQRFQLFASSQEDVFGDNDEEDDYVSTPAEHIGSLQLSAKPMLVPETVDEMESEGPLTPPHMIPASPTDHEHTDEESMYNINAANTLADYSKGFSYPDSSGGSSRGSGDKTLTEGQDPGEQQLERLTPVEDQEFVMRPGPTLVGEDQQMMGIEEEEESLHLHLSASHPSQGSCLQQISPNTNSESPEVIEYVTETPKKRPPTESVSANQEMTLTSEDQSESRIVRISTPKGHAPPTLPRQLTRTPEDVIVIDSGSVDTADKEVSEQQLSLCLSPSEGQTTQKSISSCGQTSNILEKGKKSPGYKRQKHKRHIYCHQHKRQKHKHETETHIVVWRDNVITEVTEKPPESCLEIKDTDFKRQVAEASKEPDVTANTSKSSGPRFSDDFHLTLPKAGDLLHPAGEVTLQTVQQQQHQQSPPTTGAPLEERQPSEKTAEESLTCPKSPTLTLSMIQADSEAVTTEPVFRLEKPELRPSDMEPSEDNPPDDIFKRAKIKSPRKHWKYIQDDDSDEDYISPNQPQKIPPPQPAEEGNQTSEIDLGESSVVTEPQQPQPQSIIQEPDVLTENTVSYDVDIDPKAGEPISRPEPDQPQQGASMEVLEAIPIGPMSDKVASAINIERAEQSSEIAKSHGTGDKEVVVKDQDSSFMKPPSTPTMSQDRQSIVERPKTPASVQNILKTYSDIIHNRTTPLRQRSASVDITHQDSSVKASLLRQHSYDVTVTQSGIQSPSLPKEQSQKLSQLTIQTQSSAMTGVSKGGSGSPKGGSSSPKGGWMSSRKFPDSINEMEKVQTKSGSVSPNSNPPKSPKGLDITELSHDLLQSFKQSKKNRHHSGNSMSVKQNGNGGHTENKAKNGNLNGHQTDKTVHAIHQNRGVQNDNGSYGDENGGHRINGHVADKTNKKSYNCENVLDKTPHKSKAIASVGHTPHKNILSSPLSKHAPSTPRATDSCDVSVSQRPSGIENQVIPYAIGSQGQGQNQNRTPLPEASTVTSIQKSAATASYSEIKSTKRKEKSRQKTKTLLSSAERMKRRTSVDSNASSKITTGSFVSSTGKFLRKETSLEPLSTTTGSQSLDPFTFQGSQSQRETRSAPRMRKYTSSSFERTPVSTRKRKKTILKKSGVKKQRVAADTGNPGSQEPKKGSRSRSEKDSGSAKSDKDPGTSTSLTSEPTVTTVGSLQSIPSSISQASPVGGPVMSPSSSGSNQRRLSLEPLPDTLQLESEDHNYQQVTVVTEITKFYIMGTKTKRQVIGSQGQILESTVTEQKGEPKIVEERTTRKVQLIYVPSPSRSVSSLTSGDLADISSSMSRSASSSLGSKVSITGGSFDQSQKSPDQSLPQPRVERSDSIQGQSAEQSQRRVERSGSLQGQGHEHDTNQSERRTAEFLEPQPSTSKHIHELLRKDTLKQTSKPSTPEVPQKPPAAGVTPLVTPSMAIPSDTDGSDVGTPLGSTINKTGSYIHSRTVSEDSPKPVERLKDKGSPKASDSLFSSADEKAGKHDGMQTRRQSSGTSDGSLIPAGQKRLTQAEPVTTETDQAKPTNREAISSSNDQISPEIPYQDQAISSSGSAENTALIPSTGETGSRVIAKWKDGYYYPGTVKGKDRYGRFQVRFDDGDSMSVKTVEVLLVDKLPADQSVLVQTEAGDFESGMIIHQNEDRYLVETDSGSRKLYSQGQVILTSDQASCLIADKGTEIMIELPGQPQQPVNVGDVSLENLLDAPRRSAKKVLPEVKVKDEDRGQGHASSRGRKRKLEPKATSTPTPKGKQDTDSPKKRKTVVGTPKFGDDESSLLGVTSSPVSAKRSPRKARVGLFTSDLGPIPTKKLFRGMVFLFTNVDKTVEQQNQEKQLLQDSSLETSTDESAAEQEVVVPFDKNHLKSQIEAGGGRVLEKFDIDVIDACKKCYTLSSSYQRTIKYLQSLACGIVCVAHHWVVNSCKQDKLLDHKSYILPAGISLEKKKVMEWKCRRDVFVGVKAFIVSKDSKFCDCWSEILRLAKCSVLPKLQYSDLDVIVTDSGCSPATVRQAEAHGVALVSTEWVIQSLINGKLMKYNGHPRYQYDFCQVLL